jgi:hypothetical protein
MTANALRTLLVHAIPWLKGHRVQIVHGWHKPSAAHLFNRDYRSYKSPINSSITCKANLIRNNPQKAVKTTTNAIPATFNKDDRIFLGRSVSFWDCAESLSVIMWENLALLKIASRRRAICGPARRVRRGRSVVYHLIVANSAKVRKSTGVASIKLTA